MSLEPQLSSLCRETAGLFNSQIHGNHLLDSQLRYALEDAQTRFSIWIGNVGALAPGKAGIDYRLRDYEEMANILFSLLDRLKTKLEKVSDTSLAILEEDEMEKEEEDGDEREGQAAYGGVIGSTSNISEKHLTLDLSAFETSSTSGITSATSSLHSSSSKENGSSSYASSNEAYGAQWSDTVRAMNGIIDRLFRFATVLRNPTSTSEDARVRAFMAKHADTHLEDPDNEDFTNHTRWFIDLRLPKLPKELKDRLHNTMQFRRMMLLYRQRHQAKLKKTEVGLQKDHWSPAEKAPERTTLDLESMVDIFDHGSSSEVASLNTLVTALDVLSAPQPSAEQRRPAVKVPGQSVVLSDTIASSVNKRKLPRYQKSIMSKVSAITRTGEERRRQLGVPAAPEEQSAIALHFECPYCFQLINKDERIEPRWSRHLLRDIKPYVCIFPACGQADVLFRTPEDWLSHLQTHVVIWCCQALGHDDCIFEYREGLEEHFVLGHAEEDLNQAQISHLVELGKSVNPDVFAVLNRKLVVSEGECPLCQNFSVSYDQLEPATNPTYAVENANRRASALYNHILLHLESLALKCLPGDDMEAEENTSRSGTHRSRSLIYGLSTNRSWSFDSIGEVGKELDLQDSGTEEMGAGNSTALGMEDSKVTDYEYVMADIYEKIQKQNLQQDDPVLRRLIEGQTKIRLTEENRPLRLLSLEYGGTRGLSMLFILQRLLHDIGKAEGRPAPKVCDYFDMITGSTSGGLIAIMLGTLEMEIEDCITAFDSFSEECFKYDRLDTDNADLYTQDTVHRAANQLLRFAGVSVHSSFIQPTDASSEKCKVLIYTTKIDGKPYYLRSYVPKHPGIDVDDVEAFPSLAPCNIRIVDAIQACLAVDVLSTRVWFPEMALHSFLKTSQLGPTCNATKYILAEAALQFPGRQIGSLVTLGTSPLKFALAESIYHLPILADTIATLANRLFRNAEALYSEALISTSPLPKCFRFCPPTQLLQSIDEVSEFCSPQSIEGVYATTEAYISDPEVAVKFEACISSLLATHPIGWCPRPSQLAPFPDAIWQSKLTFGRDLCCLRCSAKHWQILKLLVFFHDEYIPLDLLGRCIDTHIHWCGDRQGRYGNMQYFNPIRDLDITALSDFSTRCLPETPECAGSSYSLDRSAWDRVISEICSFRFAYEKEEPEPVSGDPQEFGPLEVNPGQRSTSDGRRFILHKVLRSTIPHHMSDVDRNKYSSSCFHILFNSVKDSVNRCMRAEGEPYRPIIVLAGGTTFDLPSLAKQLHEIGVQGAPLIKTLLDEKMTTVPEVDSFASVLAVFYLVFLYRLEYDKARRSSTRLNTFRLFSYEVLRDQSCGWDKVNNEIERARRLHVAPNLLQNLMACSVRAPEVWRNEFEPPTAFELLAKAENRLLKMYRKKRDGKKLPTGWESNILPKEALPSDADFLDWSLVPMWENVRLGAKAINEADIAPTDKLPFEESYWYSRGAPIGSEFEHQDAPPDWRTADEVARLNSYRQLILDRPAWGEELSDIDSD